MKEKSFTFLRNEVIFKTQTSRTNIILLECNNWLISKTDAIVAENIIFVILYQNQEDLSIIDKLLKLGKLTNLKTGLM